MPLVAFGDCRTAMFEIVTLCVPFCTCGGPETTATSWAPFLFRWYWLATWSAICLVICAVEPLFGFHVDQPEARAFEPVPVNSRIGPTTAPTRTMPRPA